MKFILILLFVLAGFMSNAQSPFKSEPKFALRPTFDKASLTGAISTQPDSIVNAWRFTANIAPVGYTFNGSYQLMAGAEYGWQHQSYSYATQTYTTLYSVNAAWFPINSANGVHSIADLSSVAVLFGFDNNLIQVGPMYNPNSPVNQRWGFCAVIGITLN